MNNASPKAHDFHKIGKSIKFLGQDIIKHPKSVTFTAENSLFKCNIKIVSTT